MTMAVPNFKISLMKKCGFARVTHSDTRGHFIVQSARCSCLVTGEGTIQTCKVCIVKSIVGIYEIKFFKIIQSFIQSSLFKNDRKRQKTDERDLINLG